MYELFVHHWYLEEGIGWYPPPWRKWIDNTVMSVKPSRNKPASALGMLQVTSTVSPNIIKAALNSAPAAKASFMSVAARPVARMWPVMLIGVPF